MKYIIGIFILSSVAIVYLASHTENLGAATLIYPPVGGTGIGSASQTGKTLVVTSTIPFRYSLENAGGTVGPGTSTQVAVFDSASTITSYLGLTYNDTLTTLTFGKQGQVAIFQTPNGVGSQSGVDWNVLAGTGGSTGAGGSLTMRAGDGSTNNDGGNAVLQGGASAGGSGRAGYAALYNSQGLGFVVNATLAGGYSSDKPGVTSEGQMAHFDTSLLSTDHEYKFPDATGTLALTSDISGYILSGTSPSIGGGLLTAGSCASATTTITGATSTMVVDTSPVTYPGDGTEWQSYISKTNEVTTKVCAIVGLTPSASVYRLRLIP